MLAQVPGALSATAQGSFEYSGVPGGTFSNSIWSANWPLGSYDFKAGDFNNDTRSDLIVTNTSGSYEYLGILGGGFYQASWPAGLSYLLNQSLIVPGDYNGDKSWDLLAQNNTAAYEIHGQSGVDGGFTAAVWSNSDFSRINRVNLTSGGDFNGDDKWDAIISTGDTSYLYLGQANSAGITPSAWHANLPSYSTHFYAGQFRGKATTDLIVTSVNGPTANGTDEYLGLTTGGFSTGAWLQPSLVDVEFF